MRIYTKYMELPEDGDAVYACDSDVKGVIRKEDCGMYYVDWEREHPDLDEEYEFNDLMWDDKNHYWEIWQ